MVYLVDPRFFVFVFVSRFFFFCFYLFAVIKYCNKQYWRFGQTFASISIGQISTNWFLGQRTFYNLSAIARLSSLKFQSFSLPLIVSASVYGTYFSCNSLV